MNLKKNMASKLPAIGPARKIHVVAKFLPARLLTKMPSATAGFTGLTWYMSILVPASSMAPKYEPARIMVWMAASFVNLVFGSVDERYMNTKKKLPMISRMICWKNTSDSMFHKI